MDFMRLASGACCMSTDCIPSTGGNIQKKTTWKDIGYVTEDSLTWLTKLNQLKSVWEKDQEFLHKNCKAYRNLKNKLYSTDLSEFPSNPQWPAVFTFSFCGRKYPTRYHPSMVHRNFLQDWQGNLRPFIYDDSQMVLAIPIWHKCASWTSSEIKKPKPYI